MTVWEIYQLINFWTNKDQSGRSYTPDQFNIGLKAVDIEFLKTKYGLPEEYRPGAPLPRQAWEVSQKITDDLRHLKVYMGGRDEPLLQLDQYGFADFPSDYIHVSTARYDESANTADCEVVEETSNPIEILNDEDFDSRISTRIRKKLPSAKYPIARLQNSYIEFRPRNLKFVAFTYIRMPRPGVLGYTVDENNDIIYDATTSTQVEWPQDMHTDLANTLYQWLSRNIQLDQGLQQSEARKQQGQ